VQYFVDFKGDGNIAGFYIDEIHQNIPKSAVPITIEEWQEYSADASRYKLDGETIRAKTQEELDAEWAARPPAPPSELEIIGEQLVQRELEALELRTENQMLGQQIVDLELRLLALEGGAGA